jgi:mono/diheme cytochrome c family protein
MARSSGKLGLGALALAIAAIPLASAVAAGEEAKLADEQMVKGRQLFTDNSCVQCHTLADASAQGSIGPALDGNAKLDKATVIDRITNGQGAMPSFGWLSTEDIDLLAGYVLQAKK